MMAKAKTIKCSLCSNEHPELKVGKDQMVSAYRCACGNDLLKNTAKLQPGAEIGKTFWRDGVRYEKLSDGRVRVLQFEELPKASEDGKAILKKAIAGATVVNLSGDHGKCPGCGGTVVPELVTLEGDIGCGTLQGGRCQSCGREPLDFFKYGTKEAELSYRDRAALAALTGLVAKVNWHDLRRGDKSQAAKTAYQVADAMVAERKKGGEG